MHQGPKIGLAIIKGLLQHDMLSSYHGIYAVQADFCTKLGLKDEAIKSYRRAIELVRQEPEERYLIKKLSEIL